MGFGEELLAEVPFGFSTQPSIPTRVVPKFNAYGIDVSTRDVPIDENGFYKSIHPIDHFVRNNLSIQLGAIPADPSIGSTLFAVQFDTDEIMNADVTRRVRAALQRLIDNDDLQLLGVGTEGSSGSSGRVVFVVEYNNLRLPEGERLRRQTFELSQ
jgi:hypothetical protein